MTKRLDDPCDVSSDRLIGARSGKARLVWYLGYGHLHDSRTRRLACEVLAHIRDSNAVIEIRPYGAVESGEMSARAIIAGAKQGQCEKITHAVTSHPGNISDEDLTQLAVSTGLDVEQFISDCRSEDTATNIATFRDDAMRLGATASGLYIEDRYYHGVWDENSVIEAIEKPFGYRLRESSNDFYSWAASAGLVLVLSTIAALVLVNIGFHHAYEHARATLTGIKFGDGLFELSIEQWVNDGLMAIFFLLVGIEIKREIVDGELSDLSKAMLPIVGALGGMVMPALIYSACNIGRETISGWGVPMATDIAFTLGLIALLGRRVPMSLVVFVSALAIADDLGAILVIALFYGHGFHLTPFLWAGGVLALMFALNFGRVYARTPYLLLGAALWYFVFESGIHATLAGVLTAMAIPSRKSGNVAGAAAQASALLEAELQRADEDEHTGALTIGTHAFHSLQLAIDRLREPGFHLQHSIERWCNFLILPLFAFFNMGILMVGTSFEITTPESLGVIGGLMIGKPLGIVLFCGIATKLGIAQLGDGISWRQMIGAGFLAGVGFTMSIFIATAAFDEAQLPGVKLSILLASCAAAGLGMVILYSSAPVACSDD